MTMPKNFPSSFGGVLANGKYKRILDLEVDIESHSYNRTTVSHLLINQINSNDFLSKGVLLEDQENNTHSYSAGSEFKAIIKYNDDDNDVNICMDENDNNIVNNSIDFGNIIRFFVQVLMKFFEYLSIPKKF